MAATIEWQSQLHAFSATPEGLRHVFYPLTGDVKDRCWASEVVASDTPLVHGSQVSATVTYDLGQLDVFADTTDGRLLHAWHTPGWSGMGAEVLP